MERQVVIHGPNWAGEWFIRDADNNVWDGECWRGFGCARLFASWRAVWTYYRRHRGKLRRR